MRAFAEVCDSIARVPGKLEKVERLAAYLRSLDDANLEAAARFFTGNPFAQREQKNLSLGGSTIVAAARNVWNFTDEELSAAYRQSGDLGSALGSLWRAPMRLGLFAEPLTPVSLKSFFERIARASGKHSATLRQQLCEQILASCITVSEATYAIKIITGDLRIGLREGLVTDAIARAFDCDPAGVRRAAMACGDIGNVGVAARHGALDGIAVAYGSPVQFMLASPVAYGSTYRELDGAAWILEDKYDGIRAQAHKRGSDVRLFSRTLNDVSPSYPEVIDALRAMAGDFIVDGELIAHRGEAVLPFRYLQARLQRKTISPDLLADVPVRYACFDLLAAGSVFLLDEPLLERRRRLAEAIVPCVSVTVATYRPLGGTASDEIHAQFEDARARGHEGLMLKRVDSPYSPGRRGKWWLKLKKELSTLDVVVVVVEWGHGKRAKVLSDYTFAVRGRNGDLSTIGKAYSGLTDAEIADLSVWFLAHKTGGALAGNSRAMRVEPSIVLEVAFDVIQKSALHQSGFALRFPRIVRIRDDKPANDIDSIERVEELYDSMLRREGLDP